MDDDRARQHFLDAVLARVGDGGGRLVAEYRPMAPFPGTCAALRTEGVPGAAILIPVSVAFGAKIFASFPGPGVPHIELYVTSSAGDDWLRGISGHLCTCDIELLVTAIRSWRDAPLPRQPLQAAPLTADDLGPLRAIAKIRQALARIAVDTGRAAEPWGHSKRWEGFGLVNGLGAEQAALTAEARAHLAADVEHLDPARLLGNAPRDDRGRLALGVLVLLASYETIDPQRPIYGMWLAAHSPERRRDPQVMTLRLHSAISENQPRRWDSARWLWDAQAGNADEGTRWGVSDLPVATLGLERHAEHTAALEGRCGPGWGELRDRVALCILWQDGGRIEEALELCGVEVATEVITILRGTMLGLDGVTLAERWSRFLQAQLRNAAPWRFEAVVAGEAARLRSWAAAKRGRRYRAPRLRLIALPHQTQQSKASLFLVGTGPEDRVPRLEIEHTASNARLSEPLWQRPLDLDLARFELL